MSMNFSSFCFRTSCLPPLSVLVVAAIYYLQVTTIHNYSHGMSEVTNITKALAKQWNALSNEWQMRCGFYIMMDICMSFQLGYIHNRAMLGKDVPQCLQWHAKAAYDCHLYCILLQVRLSSCIRDFPHILLLHVHHFLKGIKSHLTFL